MSSDLHLDPSAELRRGGDGPRDDPGATPWPPLRYWASVTSVVVLVLLAAALVRSALEALLLVVIALVLAVGAEPAIAGLTRRDVPRGAAVALVLAGLILAAGSFAVLVAPPLIRQASGLGADVPTYLSGLEARDDWLGTTLRANHVADHVRTFIEDLPRTAGRSFGTVLGVAGRIGGLVFGAVTVAVLTVSFMLAMPRMRTTAPILVRPHHRRQATRVIDSSIERIGGYVMGNAITSAVCGIASLLALLALGIPFAVPLALWAGLADLVPVVGAFVGAAPAVIVAFVASPARGILTLLFFIVYQQVENYVLVPRVMAGAVKLSPAAVIIATLVGGSLAGLAGALLALPVAATLKVVLVEVWLRDRVRAGDGLAREQLRVETSNEGATDLRGGNDG